MLPRDQGTTEVPDVAPTYHRVKGAYAVTNVPTSSRAVRNFELDCLGRRLY